MKRTKIKNTYIKKIRQLTNDIVSEIGCIEPNPTEKRCLSHALRILALLPCPICNGTGEIPDDFNDCGGVAGACVEIMHMNGKLMKPCPDCQ